MCQGTGRGSRQPSHTAAQKFQSPRSGHRPCLAYRNTCLKQCGDRLSRMRASAAHISYRPTAAASTLTQLTKLQVRVYTCAGVWCGSWVPGPTSKAIHQLYADGLHQGWQTRRACRTGSPAGQAGPPAAAAPPSRRPGSTRPAGWWWPSRWQSWGCAASPAHPHPAQAPGPLLGNVRAPFSTAMPTSDMGGPPVDCKQGMQSKDSSGPLQHISCILQSS